MDKLIIYAIFDKLTGTYSLPILQPHEIIMKRYFIHMINSTKNPTQEPTDYQLYELGYYFKAKGYIKVHEKPIFMINGYFKNLNKSVEKPQSA